MSAPSDGRVLLLAPATSYRVAAYLEAARALDVKILLGCPGKFALVGGGYSGITLDYESLPELLRRVDALNIEESIAAVVAADDSTVETASVVANYLGVSHNPLSAARATRRKDLGRACLKTSGLAHPSFFTIDLSNDLCAEIARARYPAVVKPLAMSGSRGVIRVDDPDALLAALERIRPLVAASSHPEERGAVLVEDFIPGEEIALEGLLNDGNLTVLSIFDKPEPLLGPYFEESYYITPSRHADRLQTSIAETIAEGCRAYGLREGPIHAEARIRGEEVWILEIAARTIGGDCARLLNFGTGHTLEALVLGNALRRRVSMTRSGDAAGVLMLPITERGTLRRVEGIGDARRCRYVEDVTIAVREGYELVPLPEGASYLGFVFARGPTPELVEAALREANRHIRPVLAPVWHIGTRSTS